MRYAFCVKGKQAGWSAPHREFNRCEAQFLGTESRQPALFERRNEMVEQVEVRATYSNAKQVPFLGQRKKMLVNGQARSLCLNELRVARKYVWDEEKQKDVYEFTTVETWGSYSLS